MKNNSANMGSNGAEILDNPKVNSVIGCFKAKIVRTIPVSSATIQADLGV